LLDDVRGLGLTSLMSVPLIARGRVLGAISFLCDEPGGRFDEEDLAEAEELARRAAIAVDNARLFHEAERRADAARVLAYVGDGVFLLDRRGVVRLWNRAASAITGLTSARVVGRPVTDAVPGWAAIADRVPIAEAPGASSQAETLPLELPDRELWISVSGVGFREGTVFAFRDLTEERALEQMKSDFVSTVSHELRTPLAAIYGAALTLRRSDLALGEVQRESLLTVIANEADRLARTVNDILWTSRLDSDSLHVAIGSCDAAALARDVVDAAEIHRPADIELELAVADGVPPVAADPDKVRQVLANLIDNAVKYSPDGGRVEVSVAQFDGSVRFSVRDAGLGIPAAEQTRIFDKFYRLDPEMTRGVGGNGLGLYICRELIRRMDGRIWVDSVEREGSLFAFELPVAAA
jgi:PAS domain S-box-containing protein